MAICLATWDTQRRETHPLSMVDKLNSALRTVLLLALVLLFGWWTFFLRGKLGDNEGRIEEIESLNQVVLDLDSEIAELGSDLADRDSQITTLGTDLAERDERIQTQKVTITDLNADVLAGQVRIVELGIELELSEAEVQRLSAAVALLKVDHRVARLEILESVELETEAGVTSDWTRVRFSEVDPAGKVIGAPREVRCGGHAGLYRSPCHQVRRRLHRGGRLPARLVGLPVPTHLWRGPKNPPTAHC